MWPVICQNKLFKCWTTSHQYPQTCHRQDENCADLLHPDMTVFTVYSEAEGENSTMVSNEYHKMQHLGVPAPFRSTCTEDNGRRLSCFWIF